MLNFCIMTRNAASGEPNSSVKALRIASAVSSSQTPAAGRSDWSVIRVRIVSGRATEGMRSLRGSRSDMVGGLFLVAVVMVGWAETGSDVAGELAWHTALSSATIKTSACDE